MTFTIMPQTPGFLSLRSQCHGIAEMKVYARDKSLFLVCKICGELVMKVDTNYEMSCTECGESH